MNSFLLPAFQYLVAAEANSIIDAAVCFHNLSSSITIGNVWRWYPIYHPHDDYVVRKSLTVTATQILMLITPSGQLEYACNGQYSSLHHLIKRNSTVCVLRWMHQRLRLRSEHQTSNSIAYAQEFEKASAELESSSSDEIKSLQALSELKKYCTWQSGNS